MCVYVCWYSAGGRVRKGFSSYLVLKDLQRLGDPPQEGAPPAVALACHRVAGGADASHGALRSGATQQAAPQT